MANPLKGEAPLGELTLAFNYGTFIELEQKTGMKMQQLMLAVQDGLGFGQLRDFVWAGLQKHHQMSDEAVIALLDDVGFEAAATAVGHAIASFFGEQKEKGKNPPKAK